MQHAHNCGHHTAHTKTAPPAPAPPLPAVQAGSFPGRPPRTRSVAGSVALPPRLGELRVLPRLSSRTPPFLLQSDFCPVGRSEGPRASRRKGQAGGVPGERGHAAGPVQKWGRLQHPAVPGATAQALRHGDTTDRASLTLKFMCTDSHRVQPFMWWPRLTVVCKGLPGVWGDSRFLFVACLCAGGHLVPLLLQVTCQGWPCPGVPWVRVRFCRCVSGRAAVAGVWRAARAGVPDAPRWPRGVDTQQACQRPHPLPARAVVRLVSCCMLLHGWDALTLCVHFLGIIRKTAENTLKHGRVLHVCACSVVVSQLGRTVLVFSILIRAAQSPPINDGQHAKPLVTTCHAQCLPL